MLNFAILRNLLQSLLYIIKSLSKHNKPFCGCILLLFEISSNAQKSIVSWIYIIAKLVFEVIATKII